jgi:endonuclease YncB( thermonuclease family)
VRWSDGDSFKFKSGPHEGSGVRLVGFNTLESYGPVHRWGDWSAAELYGIASTSKDYAASRVWNCSSSGEKDGYGRLLVDCPDAAEALILAGHAHAFSMEGPSPDALVKAQAKAQRSRRGIWQKGVPQSVLTSIHSITEGAGYNRRVDTATGESTLRKHLERFAICEEVCSGGAAGSCMVYVPYAQRYRDKPDCLK